MSKILLFVLATTLAVPAGALVEAEAEQPYEYLGYIRGVSAGAGQALAYTGSPYLYIYAIENKAMEKKKAPFDGMYFYDAAGTTIIGFEMDTY